MSDSITKLTGSYVTDCNMLLEEIAGLKQKLGFLQIHSDHTETLLKSCEQALADRDINSIPVSKVEALIDAISPGMVNGALFSEVLKSLLPNQPKDKDNETD